MDLPDHEPFIAKRTTLFAMVDQVVVHTNKMIEEVDLLCAEAANLFNRGVSEGVIYLPHDGKPIHVDGDVIAVLDYLAVIIGVEGPSALVEALRKETI